MKKSITSKEKALKIKPITDTIMKAIDELKKLSNDKEHQIECNTLEDNTITIYEKYID